jgi:hypothetical protein
VPFAVNLNPKEGIMNYMIVFTGPKGSQKVAATFHAPDEATAKIIARAYIRSMAAHTKHYSVPFSQARCKLYPVKQA